MTGGNTNDALPYVIYEVSKGSHDCSWEVVLAHPCGAALYACADLHSGPRLTGPLCSVQLPLPRCSALQSPAVSVPLNADLHLLRSSWFPFPCSCGFILPAPPSSKNSGIYLISSLSQVSALVLLTVPGLKITAPIFVHPSSCAGQQSPFLLLTRSTIPTQRLLKN